MALITLLNAQLAFGHVALLDHADFSLEAGERVGLIGRNGAGKSSMLKILAGMEKPDDGVLQVQTGVQIAYLLAVILASASGLPPREVLEALAVVVLVTTVASGVDYVTRFARRAGVQITAEEQI